MKDEGQGLMKDPLVITTKVAEVIIEVTEIGKQTIHHLAEEEIGKGIGMVKETAETEIGIGTVIETGTLGENIETRIKIGTEGTGKIGLIAEVGLEKRVGEISPILGMKLHLA